MTHITPDRLAGLAAELGVAAMLWPVYIGDGHAAGAATGLALINALPLALLSAGMTAGWLWVRGRKGRSSPGRKMGPGNP